MSIDNRKLVPGTRLVARYKGQQYSAQVVQTDQGLRYQLADGRQFKSPSAAGSAVMGGSACNGWRFWTVEGQEPAAPRRAPVGAKSTKAPRARTAKAPKKAKKLTAFERIDNGAPDGQATFYCTACADAFTAPATVEPIGCPKGHSAKEQSAARPARSDQEG